MTLMTLMTLIIFWDIHMNFRDPFREDGTTKQKVVYRTFCLHSAVKNLNQYRTFCLHSAVKNLNQLFLRTTSVLQLLLRWQYRLEKAAPSYFWGTNARRPAHSEDWDVCMIVVVATLALWSKLWYFVRLFLDLFSS